MPEKKIQIRVEAEANVDAVKVLDTSLSNLEKHLDAINAKQEVLFVEPTAKLDAMLDKVAAARSGAGHSLAVPPGSVRKSQLSPLDPNEKVDAVQETKKSLVDITPLIEQATKATDGFHGSLYNILRSAGVGGFVPFIARLSAGLGAAVLAFRAATKSVEEFASSEAALGRLDAALASNGQLTEKLRDSVVGLAKEMSGASNTSVTKWIETLSALTLAGAPAEDLGKYAEGVKNLAAIMGGDMASASKVMAQAVQGNFQSLKQFGIQAGNTGDEVETLNGLLAELAAKGGNISEQMAKTLDGSWAKFVVTLENAGRATGHWLTAILPIQSTLGVLSTALGGVASSIEWMLGKAGLSVKALEGMQGALRGAKRDSTDATTAAHLHADALERIKIATQNVTTELGEESKRLGFLVSAQRSQIETEKQLALEKIKRELIEHPERRAELDIRASEIEAKSKEQLFKLEFERLKIVGQLKDAEYAKDERKQKQQEEILAAQERHQKRNELKNTVKTLVDQRSGLQDALEKEHATFLNPIGYATGNDEALGLFDSENRKAQEAITSQINAKLKEIKSLGSYEARDKKLGSITGNQEEDAKALKEQRDRVRTGRIDLGGKKADLAEEQKTLELEKSTLQSERQDQRKIEKSQQATKKAEKLHEAQVASVEKYIHDLDRQAEAEERMGRDPRNIILRKQQNERLLNRLRSTSEIGRLDADAATDAKTKADIHGGFKNSVDKLGRDVLSPPPDQSKVIKDAFTDLAKVKDKENRAVLSAIELQSLKSQNVTNAVLRLQRESEIRFMQIEQQLNP